MLAAWDVQTDELVTIEPGQANELRSLCWAGRLLCPFENCESRAITTWSGYTNRWGTYVADGFRHREVPPDGEHSPESLRHLDGKVAVRDWLRHVGFESVSVERPVRVRPHHGVQQPRRARVRRPDVLGQHPTGPTLAVEVQVSPISETEWRQRTQDLTSSGRGVLWLWSWPTETKRHTLTTALRASVGVGHEMWFLDPYGEDGPRLGRAWQTRRVGDENFKVAPHDFEAALMYDWSPIGELTVGPDGRIRRPGEDDEARRLHDARQRQRAQEAAERRAWIAERRDLERRRAAAEERDRRMLAEADVRRAARLARAAFREPAAPAVVLDPDIAAVCEKDNRADDRVWVPAKQLKSAVALRLMQRKQVPATVSRLAIVEFVEQNFPCDSGTVGPAVRMLLDDLTATGAVRAAGDQVRVLRTMGDNPEQLPLIPDT
jgi:hypothetical protein